jgi:hypothetical protein
MRLSFPPAGPLPGRLVSVFSLDYANVREWRKKKRAAMGPPFLPQSSTRSRDLPLPAPPAETRREDEGAEQDELDTEGP